MKIFQKKLQADNIKIVDLVPETKKCMHQIERMHECPLLGGWEEACRYDFDKEKASFFGKILWQKECHSNQINLVVSETRTFTAMRI